MTAVLASERIAIEIHRDFASLGLDAKQWAAVAAQGDTFTVFQDWHWQRVWWESFGRGELTIVVAREDGRIRAMAPMFVDSRMAYLVGSGSSDYLDFIGDVDGDDLIVMLLGALIDEHPDLLGIVLYLVPDASRTGKLVANAAKQLGLDCFDEGLLVAPVMSMPDAASAQRAATKTSLVRHERRFASTGRLRVHHLREASEILPWLDAFFDQHQARWHATAYPSLFRAPEQRAFYGRLTQAADASKWLRFTVVLWDDKPIAFHFGFAYNGNFLWYKPSFDITLAHHSPGEVLLRQLILAANAEGATAFDFGLGDEPFKRRFANGVRNVRTWGLYPPGVPDDRSLCKPNR